VTADLARYGAYAVFALMAIDAVLPASGELAMLYAGVLAAGANATLFGVRLAAGLEAYLVLSLVGTAGSLAGALLGWSIGARGGRTLLERHGSWFRLDAQTLARADRWFARWGDAAVLLGRLTPIVRSFISIPAGALGSPLVRYTLLSLTGSLIWCFGFAAAGWMLGAGWTKLPHYYGDAEIILAAAAVTAIAVAGVYRRRRRRPA
jgi:membrane protein DedA with SNARE-associated domain